MTEGSRRCASCLFYKASLRSNAKKVNLQGSMPCRIWLLNPLLTTFVEGGGVLQAFLYINIGGRQARASLHLNLVCSQIHLLKEIFYVPFLRILIRSRPRTTTNRKNLVSLFSSQPQQKQDMWWRFAVFHHRHANNGNCDL